MWSSKSAASEFNVAVEVTMRLETVGICPERHSGSRWESPEIVGCWCQSRRFGRLKIREGRFQPQRGTKPGDKRSLGGLVTRAAHAAFPRRLPRERNLLVL